MSISSVPRTAEVLAMADFLRKYHPQEEAAREAEGGKARMREYGSVSIPQEAFIAALRMGEE